MSTSLSSVQLSICSLLSFSLHGEQWLPPLSWLLAVAADDLVFVDDIGDVIRYQVGSDCSCGFNYYNLFL